MTQEALKLALEALETGLCYVENEDFDNKQKFRGYEHLMPTDAAESIQEIKTAIAAIKEALAQPEQEPVGWQFYEGGIWHNGSEKHNHRANTEAAGIPTRSLYTSPPPRKPLTDEMVKRMKENCTSMEMRGAFADGWLSAEAAHGIKGEA